MRILFSRIYCTREDRENKTLKKITTYTVIKHLWSFLLICSSVSGFQTHIIGKLQDLFT
jgi:hypothetical protein